MTLAPYLPRSTPGAQGIPSGAISAFVSAAERNLDALHSFVFCYNWLSWGTGTNLLVHAETYAYMTPAVPRWTIEPLLPPTSRPGTGG